MRVRTGVTAKQRERWLWWQTGEGERGLCVSMHVCVCVCERVCTTECEREANPDHDSTPLSTSATRRSRDRSLTRTVEVLDQRAIQDVPGRNPTPLLRTVPLPVHQKLVTTPTRAHVKELTDSVNRSLLVNRRRGKGGGGSERGKQVWRRTREKPGEHGATDGTIWVWSQPDWEP